MTGVAAKMNDREIKAVADYIAGLRADATHFRLTAPRGTAGKADPHRRQGIRPPGPRLDNPAMTTGDASPVSTAGLRDPRALAALREAIELVSSMRFAITLLTVICIASVIGTVVKQHEPVNNVVNQFGPFWAELFITVGLTRSTARGGSC